MQKTLIIIFGTFVLGFFVIFNGCSNNSVAYKFVLTNDNDISKHPKIFFPELAHDFGTVNANSRVEHTFAFTNEGTAPLDIKKIGKSCGCIATQKGAKVLQPGEASEITVAYSVGRYSGHRSKKVTVESNDPDNPQLTLTLTAEIPHSADTINKTKRFAYYRKTKKPNKSIVRTSKNVPQTSSIIPKPSPKLPKPAESISVGPKIIRSKNPRVK